MKNAENLVTLLSECFRESRSIEELAEKLTENGVSVTTACEVSHGHWKEEDKLPRSSKFRCSVCDGLAYFVQPTRDETWEKCCPYKYCPNCGAKMDGEMLPNSKRNTKRSKNEIHNKTNT